MKLSTHRVIQLHILADTCAAHSRSSRRAATNAASIGNWNARAMFLRAAQRNARVAFLARKRLEGAA